MTASCPGRRPLAGSSGCFAVRCRSCRGAVAGRYQRGNSGLAGRAEVLYVGLLASCDPARIEFRILGSLEVLAGGRVVSLVGSKQRALLALLLIHANETLSTDRLIDELWGEDPPATAVRTVHVHVSRLRKVLAADDGSPGPVVTHDHGYALEADRELIDAHRFERLVLSAR